VWCPVIDNNSVGPPGWGLLCLKTETELASEKMRFFKKLNYGQVLKKKIVSFKFSHALFYLLDFLTLEGGTERLF
jgi:hypothetical protein